MSLERRTELGRSTTPMKRGRLASRSPQTITDAPVRAEVRDDRLALDGGRCQLEGHGPCRGRLQCHEVLRRSSKKGSQLVLKFTTTLCDGHHDLDLHRLLAQQLGIRVTRWAWDRHGDIVLITAMAHRAVARTGVIPPDPWWV